MAKWRVGLKLGRTLYRDEVCVGMVDTAEIAAEIVGALNRTRYEEPAVENWDWTPDSGRGRSPGGFLAVRAQTCGYCLSRHDVGADNRFEIHLNSIGQHCTGSLAVAP